MVDMHKEEVQMGMQSQKRIECRKLSVISQTDEDDLAKKTGKDRQRGSRRKGKERIPEKAGKHGLYSMDGGSALSHGRRRCSSFLPQERKRQD